MRHNARVRQRLAWAVFILATGCGPPDERPSAASDDHTAGGAGAPAADPGGSSGGAGAGAQDAGGTVSDYPAGPYGEGDPEVGDVIENLKLQGLVFDAAAAEPRFVTTSLGALREIDAALALIHVPAVWCSSCKAAAADLAARQQEILDAGGAIIELVHEGQDGSPPSESELRAWATAYRLHVPTAGGADARAHAVFPDRDTAYVVDLRTMTVVWRERGLYATPTIGATGADALLARL